MNKAERLAIDGAVDPILFYSHKDPWGVLSNFSRHPVTLTHPWTGYPCVYETSEHRYQAMKATNADDHDQVTSALGPSASKDWGGKILLRDDWGNTPYSICWYVMYEVCIAKALQHDDVLHTLADSGSRHLYEDSPIDDIWGWRYRSNYSGKNLLGKVWMEIRNQLLN